MKRIIVIAVIILLSMAAHTQAQSDKERVNKYFPNNDGLIVYTEVIKLDSTYTRDLLFKNAKQWLVDNFKSGKDVLQTEDKEIGYIIGQGYFVVGKNPVGFFVTNSRIWFTVKIEVKDGRYKYTFYDTEYEYTVVIGQTPTDIKTNFSEYVATAKETKKLIAFYVEVDNHLKTTIAGLNMQMAMKDKEEW